MNYHGITHSPVHPSNESSTTKVHKQTPQFSSSGTFPFLLHDMLTDIHDKGLTEIVSFQGNKHFKVHNRKLFETIILPMYFEKQILYKSFQRQLGMYRFTREITGPWKGAYTHEYLLRGCRGNCRYVIRQRPVRSKAVKSSSAASAASSSSAPSTSSSSLGRAKLTVSSLSNSILSLPTDGSMHRGMETVIPQHSHPAQLHDEDLSSRPRSYAQSNTTNDETGWMGMINFPPGEHLSYQTDQHHASSLDWSKDPFDLAFLSLDEESFPIEFIVDPPTTSQKSDIEPLDANGRPHGFTADIADEVVRTFRFL